MGNSQGPSNLRLVPSAVADNASEVAFLDALAGDPGAKCSMGTAVGSVPEVGRDDKGESNQGAPGAPTTRTGVHAVKAEMDSAAELAFLDELAGLDTSTKAEFKGGENGVLVWMLTNFTAVSMSWPLPAPCVMCMICCGPHAFSQ